MNFIKIICETSTMKAFISMTLKNRQTYPDSIQYWLWQIVLCHSYNFKFTDISIHNICVYIFDT
jgi:hypothetical protein